MKSLNAVHVAVAIVILLAVGSLIGYAIGYDIGWEKSRTPSNFEECAAAGHPIMESYPRQCRVPDGPTFVEQITVPPVPPDDGGAAGGIQLEGCRPAGCSGQICAAHSEADGIVTDCMFRPEYQCYKNAKCERQTDGECGWTTTAQLRACLANPPAVE